MQFLNITYKKTGQFFRHLMFRGEGRKPCCQIAYVTKHICSVNNIEYYKDTLHFSF